MHVMFEAFYWIKFAKLLQSGLSTSKYQTIGTVKTIVYKIKIDTFLLHLSSAVELYYGVAYYINKHVST